MFLLIHSKNSDIKKNKSKDIDYEFYSLHYFIKLACDGQTVAMDMLHAPDEMILHSSKIWEHIIENKNRFYTKNLKSFINYARRQASVFAIKGSRINSTLEVLTVLKKENPEKRMRDIWEKLPRIEHCHDLAPDKNGNRLYQVCGKCLQESSRISYVIPIIEKFLKEYGKRAKLASENKNIDWKAVSHALRVAYQTKEIFTENKITFPLKNADFLLKVKMYKLDYLTEVAPVLESLMDDIEKLMTESLLPDKVFRV